jgi:N-acetylglucosaminyl-diphospho-decaprenol L-rhamnosyltransferase
MSGDADRSEAPDLPSVAVVVVNYRTKELTAEAVRSVLDDPLVHEVVVVDNGSGDGSVAFLRSAFPGPQVQVVESSGNLGFGRGANLGVSASHASLVFLLNSDAVALPGAVAQLAAVLVEDDGVGVAAPAVYLGDGRTLQPDVYGPFPAPTALLRTTAGRARRTSDAGRGGPGWVSGVAMMVRRSDFLSIGGFDPDFTMYLEDVDLCRRLHEAGKRAMRDPAASVVHLGGQSGSSGVARAAQFHRSKAVYLRKAGASRLQLACAGVLGMARVGLERLRAGGTRSG